MGCGGEGVDKETIFFLSKAYFNWTKQARFGGFLTQFNPFKQETHTYESQPTFRAFQLQSAKKVTCLVANHRLSLLFIISTNIKFYE